MPIAKSKIAIGPSVGPEMNFLQFGDNYFKH